MVPMWCAANCGRTPGTTQRLTAALSLRGERAKGYISTELDASLA
ncbi:hypothetical protein ACFXKR_38195 [Streptomyces violascens]